MRSACRARIPSCAHNCKPRCGPPTTSSWSCSASATSGRSRPAGIKRPTPSPPPRSDLNPELRAQLQAPLRPAYDLELELLRERYERAIAAGRDKEADAIAAAAFVSADASRAQSLGDVAAQKYSPAVRRALASEFQRREALYRELAARQFALDARVDRSGSDDPHARHLMSDIAELERQADAVNTVIASRAMSAGTARREGSARASLPSLPADTALVSYWLGSESAYAWVVLPRAIHWTRLPSPVTVADQAVAFHHSLTRLVDVPLER